MEKVTGLGGVFFRAKDPDAIRQWYVDHLGLPLAGPEDPNVVLPWREHADPERVATTVWAPFAQDTDYFGAARNQWMINFRVRDLDAMLAQLATAGAEISSDIEAMDGFGRFGWFTDPEGNRIELWEPPPGM